MITDSLDAGTGQQQKMSDDLVLMLTKEFNNLTTREHASPLHQTLHISKHDVLSLEHSGTAWSAIVQAPQDTSPKLRLPLLRKKAYSKSIKTVALIYTSTTNPLQVTVSG